MTTQSPDLEQADQEQVATTSPEAVTTDKPKVRRPGFRKDPGPLGPSPLDPSPDPAADGSRDSDDGFPGPSEQMPDEPPTSSGSSRTSSRADRKALQQAVGVGFAGATTGAHELLVRDPYAKYAGLLLADEQDVSAIAGPGGNLLARRMGEVPLGGDLGDVIELIVAGAGYILKQLGKLRLARQLRDQGAAIAGGLQPELGDQPAEPGPGEEVPFSVPLPS